MSEHTHDYRCVFSCHIGTKTPGKGLTDRQKNPWSYKTMSTKAFVASIVKELTANGQMTGLVMTERGYRSEHLLNS